MPRLPPALIRHAYNIDPSLARLLPTLRTIPAAATELRWLREHVAPPGSRLTRHERARLRYLSERRGAGVPLQYLLGTEYFGPLELAVAPGVLIPRWETAASTTCLAEKLAHRRIQESEPQGLRVLDLCSGSGCIGLLLHHQLQLMSNGKIIPRVRGVDLSTRAIRLARKNIARAVPFEFRHTVDYMLGDVLTAQDDRASTWLEDSDETEWDVIVANPPYISHEAFMSSATSRSVRCYEPRMALLPTQADAIASDEVQADVFYPGLLRIASSVNAKVVMFEVADMQQAQRVASLALERLESCNHVEIWRDEPSDPSKTQATESSGSGQSVLVRGTGNGRSVVCWRDGWL